MIPRVFAPTEASADGDAARALATALGTALNASDGTAAAADLLALAGALADSAQCIADLADEAFADTANDLLSELDRAYALAVEPDRDPDDRRDTLVAKIRAARAAAPDSILSAVHALDATATLHENTPTTVERTTDLPGPAIAGGERQVFLWSVRLAVAVWNDTTLRARLDALLDQMQPVHTDHTVHTNDPTLGFRCNDSESLVGRDAVFTV